MSEKPAPYWRLFSVLFSSVPLTPALAATLVEAARELDREDKPLIPVAGDLVSGRVVNLRRQVSLGAISGPAFEAEIETERGKGKVRYLLSREALERPHVPVARA